MIERTLSSYRIAHIRDEPAVFPAVRVVQIRGEVEARRAQVSAELLLLRAFSVDFRGSARTGASVAADRVPADVAAVARRHGLQALVHVCRRRRWRRKIEMR